MNTNKNEEKRELLCHKEKGKRERNSARAHSISAPGGKKGFEKENRLGDLSGSSAGEEYCGDV